MTGIVVSGGAIRDYTVLKKYFDKAELVICADGGARHLVNFGIKPDILVGDFDSISEHDYEAFFNAGVEIIKHPVEKDTTDTQIAAELAVERGCKSVILLASLGTRLDHSISNVFLLKRLLDLGVRGMISDEQNEAVLINENICLQKEEGYKVSLLPLTEKVFGVTTSGFYYPLENATIDIGSSWGVSNEFMEETACVSITGGLLLVIKARD